jgi:hypothetical protein
MMRRVRWRRMRGPGHAARMEENIKAYFQIIARYDKYFDYIVSAVDS